MLTAIPDFVVILCVCSFLSSPVNAFFMTAENILLTVDPSAQFYHSVVIVWGKEFYTIVFGGLYIHFVRSSSYIFTVYQIKQDPGEFPMEQNSMVLFSRLLHLSEGTNVHAEKYNLSYAFVQYDSK